MSHDANHEEKPTVLSIIASFLAAMSQPPPLDAARQYVFEPGFHCVTSDQFGNLQHSLGEAIDVAEGRKNDGKDEPGQFGLMGNPAPEVFIFDKVAAAWAGLQRIAPDGSVGFRSYSVFSLIKTSDGSWKISGFAHSHSAEVAPLPPVMKEFTPGAERLMHFAEEMWETRGKLLEQLDDWAVPGTRFVRQKLPDPATGAPLEKTLKTFADGASSIPADAKWQEDFEGVTVRLAGNLGLIWMHYIIVLPVTSASTGIDVLALSGGPGDKWRFSATQTLNRGDGNTIST
ncbi:hypothetical protein GQ53DRAFT_750778 [Thozetella sp. PMI_491]|nr:hypothetical protein GQ53DRAFT_750778 [Thozetella sp. PMI_491]